MALGSIIVPLHVNCRASSANAAMLEKTMMSDATMLVRDIDKLLTISIADPCDAYWTKPHIPSVVTVAREVTHVLNEKG